MAIGADDGGHVGATGARLHGFAAAPFKQHLAAYAGHLRDLPNAGTVQDVATRDGATYLRVTGPSDAESGAALQLVRDIRTVPAPRHAAALAGGSAALIDTLAAVSGGLPIKALALNALSLTAVFGALVWIFQDGHLAGLLGFTPGPTDVSMILLIFCIAFGLSMDYEVFLLARSKEAHDAGADTVEAVATGLARTGRIVTTAAAWPDSSTGGRPRCCAACTSASGARKPPRPPAGRAAASIPAGRGTR